MRLLAKEETPLDWTSKKIGSYVLGHKGGAALRPSDFSDVGFPVIPKKAIQPTGELLIESPTYCTNEFASNNKRSIVDNSYTITTLRDLVPTGPTIGTVVNFTSEEKYILSQGVYGLKLNDDLDKKYLSYLSNTSFYRKVMQRIMVGSTQVHIRTPEYLDLEIQIPPLLEQQKIAKILSTWDRAISTTERLIDNSTQQKKALMQQLLTGNKRLLDESGERFEGEWEEVKLGDLKLDISDGNYSAKYPKQADFLDTGIPFLRANNLDKGTISDNDMRFISPKQHSEITKGHLKKGDILLSTRGELGNVALVPDRHIGSNINAQLVRINAKDKLSGKFLFQLFDYLRVTGKFESLSTGTALKQLPIGKLKILEFDLPLLIEEQQKIATVLTNADKEIELLEQQLADLQQEKKALMQVLLTGKKRVVVDEEDV